MSSSDGNRDHTHSRMNKSLGLLFSASLKCLMICGSFINMYNTEGVKVIELDEAASQLGVERRRIYDIVNILESLGVRPIPSLCCRALELFIFFYLRVMSRKAKNQYSWKGFYAIPHALEQLKVLDNDENEVFLDRGGDERRTLKFNPNPDPEPLPFVSISSRNNAENRREKSLGLLTQNFLKLFLTMNVNMISLDEAANFLFSDIHGLTQVKNDSTEKVKRLYDIANVLASMNLIEKTYQTGSRKPVYKWLGFKGRSVNDAVFSSRPPDPQPPKKRNFGTDITNIDFVKKSKLNSSVDEKPVKMQMNSDDSTAQRHCTHLRKQKQQDPKDCSFGPFQLTGSHDTGRKGLKRNQEWKSLPSSYHPEYLNQALNDLFAHYVEAWKSWYAEVARGNNQSRNTIHPPS
ncbi:E2F transcription factor-like protein E2FE isoform X5 [Cinnamomum micranthum f. kanehirae]|uniref:E2F transcription factor-like protein E2FE isoform X5 n=1 Tax=Cinnamomum micranthum f. kanehirae TaxID=337451 RepID=A0A443NGA2_9MAGN|nr:E2F transcription factor-like protein E2FE isoform X5 [Cinnamomum micranthum f. kanehirae]